MSPLLSLLFLAASSVATLPNTTHLPTINLGYVYQQATYHDNIIDAFAFKNIRYAHPPLANLRFQPPQPPAIEPETQDGTQFGDPVCPQARSGYGGISNTSIITEDCLFLDVFVPASVQKNDSVPVLVWIHGGAYSVGSKDGIYTPTGLFKRSPAPVIYVALNYRLGAFGWLSPPHADADIVPNIGLRDIQAALDWVQKYIHLFGGDPDSVTAMGESAGAGAIMHLITAYGGTKQPPPFQQAIAQSPGLIPVKNNAPGRMRTFDAFLNHTGCSNIQDLRKANTSTLIKANDFLTTTGVTNGTGFGPIVDGDLVPDIPGKLFLEGRFHRSLRGLVSANNAHEGGFFVGDPASISPDDFQSFVDVFLPTANKTTQATIQKLYPPVPDTDKLGNWQRLVDFISDLMFTCNAQFLASSMAETQAAAYRYVFGVGSAVHGSDVDFTFFTGDTNTTNEAGQNFDTSGIVSPDQEKQVAFDMQTMIMNFVLSGRPQMESFGLPHYQESDRATLVFNASRLYTIYSDPWKNERCDWWQQGWFAN